MGYFKASEADSDSLRTVSKTLGISVAEWNVD